MHRTRNNQTAVMNTRLPPDVAANADRAMVPEEGVPAGGSGAPFLSAADRLLLQCLGTALVNEWNNLSMPLRRVLYARAVERAGSGPDTTLKRRMARFLHDHKRPPGVQNPPADSE